MKIKISRLFFLVMILLVLSLSVNSETISYDGFESGTMNGGLGFDGSWNQFNQISTQPVYEGTYSGVLTFSADTFRRAISSSVDLSEYDTFNISFYRNMENINYLSYTSTLTVNIYGDGVVIDSKVYDTNAEWKYESLLVQNNGYSEIELEFVWDYAQSGTFNIDNIEVSSQAEEQKDVAISLQNSYPVNTDNAVIEISSTEVDTLHTIELRDNNNQTFCERNILSPSIPNTVFAVYCDMPSEQLIDGRAKVYLTNDANVSDEQFFNAIELNQDTTQLEIEKVYFSPQVLQGGSTEVFAVLKRGFGVNLSRIYFELEYPDGTKRVLGMQETVNEDEYRAFITDTFQTGDVNFKINVESDKYHDIYQNSYNVVPYNGPKLQMHGTQYKAEDNAKTFIQLLDDKNQPINDSLCYVTMYYPTDVLGETVFSNQLMSYKDDGLYFYNFDAPIRRGIYMLSSYCVVDSIELIDSITTDGFESGDGTGGSGIWNTSWNLNGSSVVSSHAFDGNYSLEVENGEAPERNITCLGCSDEISLSFYWSAESLESQFQEPGPTTIYFQNWDSAGYNIDLTCNKISGNGDCYTGTDSPIIGGTYSPGISAYGSASQTALELYEDTSGYSDVAVEYKTQTVGLSAGENVYVEVTKDGGTTWTTIETWSGVRGVTTTIEQLDSSYSTTDFGIRFRAFTDSSSDVFKFDDVKIWGDYANSASDDVFSVYLVDGVGTEFLVKEIDDGDDTGSWTQSSLTFSEDNDGFVFNGNNLKIRVNSTGTEDGDFLRLDNIRITKSQSSITNNSEYQFVRGSGEVQIVNDKYFISELSRGVLTNTSFYDDFTLLYEITSQSPEQLYDYEISLDTFEGFPCEYTENVLIYNETNSLIENITDFSVLHKGDTACEVSFEIDLDVDKVYDVGIVSKNYWKENVLAQYQDSFLLNDFLGIACENYQESQNFSDYVFPPSSNINQLDDTLYSACYSFLNTFYQYNNTVDSTFLPLLNTNMNLTQSQMNDYESDLLLSQTYYQNILDYSQSIVNGLLLADAFSLALIEDPYPPSNPDYAFYFANISTSNINHLTHQTILDVLLDINETTNTIDTYLTDTIFVEIDETEEKLDELLINTSNIWDELGVLNTNILDNYAELQIIKSRISDINVSIVSEINENEARLIILKNTVDMISTEINDTVVPKLDNIDSDIVAMQSDVTDIIGYTQDLEGNQNIILSQLDDINTSLSNINTQNTQIISNLNSLNISFLDEFEIIQTNITSILESIDNIGDSGTTYNDTLLQNKINTLLDRTIQINDTLNGADEYLRNDIQNNFSSLTTVLNNVNLTVNSIDNYLQNTIYPEIDTVEEDVTNLRQNMTDNFGFINIQLNNIDTELNNIDSELAITQTLVSNVNQTSYNEIIENRNRIDNINVNVSYIRDYLNLHIPTLQNSLLALNTTLEEIDIYQKTAIYSLLNDINETNYDIYSYLQTILYPAVDDVELGITHILSNDSNIYNELISLTNDVNVNYNQLIILNSLIGDVNESIIDEINENQVKLTIINSILDSVAFEINNTIAPGIVDIQENIDYIHTNLTFIENEISGLEGNQNLVLDNLSLINNNIVSTNQSVNNVLNNVDSLNTTINNEFSDIQNNVTQILLAIDNIPGYDDTLLQSKLDNIITAATQINSTNNNIYSYLQNDIQNDIDYIIGVINQINLTVDGIDNYNQNTIYPAITGIQSDVTKVLNNQTNIYSKLLNIETIGSNNYNELLHIKNIVQELNTTLNISVENIIQEINENEVKIDSITTTVNNLESNIIDAIDPKLNQILANLTEIDSEFVEIQSNLSTLLANDDEILTALTNIDVALNDMNNTFVTNTTNIATTLETRFDSVDVGIIDIQNLINNLNTTVIIETSEIEDNIGIILNKLDCVNSTICEKLNNLSSDIQYINSSLVEVDSYLKGDITNYLININTTVEDIYDYIDNVIYPEIININGSLNNVLTNQSNIVGNIAILQSSVDDNYNAILVAQQLIDVANISIHNKMDTIYNSVYDINQSIIDEINENEGYLIDIESKVDIANNLLQTTIIPQLNNIEGNISEVKISINDSRIDILNELGSNLITTLQNINASEERIILTLNQSIVDNSVDEDYIINEINANTNLTKDEITNLINSNTQLVLENTNLTMDNIISVVVLARDIINSNTNSSVDNAANIINSNINNATNIINNNTNLSLKEARDLINGNLTLELSQAINLINSNTNITALDAINFINTNTNLSVEESIDAISTNTNLSVDEVLTAINNLENLNLTDIENAIINNLNNAINDININTNLSMDEAINLITTNTNLSVDEAEVNILNAIGGISVDIDDAITIITTNTNLSNEEAITLINSNTNLTYNSLLSEINAIEGVNATILEEIIQLNLNNAIGVINNNTNVTVSDIGSIINNNIANAITSINTNTNISIEDATTIINSNIENAITEINNNNNLSVDNALAIINSNINDAINIINNNTNSSMEDAISVITINTNSSVNNAASIINSNIFNGINIINNNTNSSIAQAVLDITLNTSLTQDAIEDIIIANRNLITTNTNLTMDTILTAIQSNTSFVQTQILNELNSIEGNIITSINTSNNEIIQWIQASNNSIIQVVQDSEGNIISAVDSSESDIIQSILDNTNHIVANITTSEGVITQAIIDSEGNIISEIDATEIATLNSISGIDNKLDYINSSIMSLGTDITSLIGDINGIQSSLVGMNTTLNDNNALMEAIYLDMNKSFNYVLNNTTSVQSDIQSLISSLDCPSPFGICNELDIVHNELNIIYNEIGNLSNELTGNFTGDIENVSYSVNNISDYLQNLMYPSIVDYFEDQVIATLSNNHRVVINNDYITELTIYNPYLDTITPDTTPLITLYDANNNTIVDDIPMVFVSNGIYAYEYSIASSGAPGVWTSEVVVEVDGNEQIIYDKWNVISNPTQVEIEAVSLCSIEVCADITITNEGSTSYEYIYNWWTTDNPFANYEDIDVVDRGQASKLLLPGQTFKTTVCLDRPETSNIHYIRARTYYGEYSFSTDSFRNDNLACREKRNFISGRVIEDLPPITDALTAAPFFIGASYMLLLVFFTRKKWELIRDNKEESPYWIWYNNPSHTNLFIGKNGDIYVEYTEYNEEDEYAKGKQIFRKTFDELKDAYKFAKTFMKDHPEGLEEEEYSKYQ